MKIIDMIEKKLIDDLKNQYKDGLEKENYMNIIDEASLIKEKAKVILDNYFMVTDLMLR